MTTGVAGSAATKSLRSLPLGLIATAASVTEQSSHLMQATDAIQRVRHARSLGAQGADRSHDLSDIVAAILYASAQRCATTIVAAIAPPESTAAQAPCFPRSATRPSGDRRFYNQTRSELSEHDTARTQFVADLLTSRADPGHLAQRAQRYGIRLSGSHVVTIAAATALTEPMVHDIGQSYGLLAEVCCPTTSAKPGEDRQQSTAASELKALCGLAPISSGGGPTSERVSIHEQPPVAGTRVMMPGDAAARTPGKGRR
jgi:hypothetical protein